MPSVNEHPIERANRRRLEKDAEWIRESSRKAADELLAGAENGARRLVGCEPILERAIRAPEGPLDKLELRYGKASVYVDYHHVPDPWAPDWPFPVTAIWREDRGPTGPLERTASVYFRVVPANGNGNRWRWRVVGSGQNEGVEETLDGMILLIFDLLTSDLDEPRTDLE